MRNIGDTIITKLRSTNLESVGKVVYIHPEKRFYVVEFQTPSGKTFKESFPWTDLEQVNSPFKIKVLKTTKDD